MKALITGINGFVGYYLTEVLLQNGLEVYGTILQGEAYNGLCQNILEMNLSNKEDVEYIISVVKPDYIYHLAGQSSVGLSWSKPELTIMTNVVGTIYLLDAIKVYTPRSRVLIVGSSDQYGIVKPEDCPIKETMYLSPQSPYATSKKAQEEIACQYIKAHNLDIVMVRAFNHIGPGQRKGFVIADFASQIAEIEKGLIPPILKVGNLEAKRDFTDVREIVRAYEMVIKSGRKGEVYNVGSGNAYKIKELLDILISCSTVEIEVQEDPERMRPSDVPLIQCDASKLKNECNWISERNISETLLDTLNYWRKM